MSSASPQPVARGDLNTSTMNSEGFKMNRLESVGLKYHFLLSFSPKFRGKYCLGERQRYQICNSTPCPQELPTFRDVQCSHFNAMPYKGKFYKWETVINKGKLARRDMPCHNIQANSKIVYPFQNFFFNGGFLLKLSQPALVSFTAVHWTNIFQRRCGMLSLMERRAMKATKAEICASMASVRYQHSTNCTCSPLNKMFSCWIVLVFVLHLIALLPC